MHEFLEESDVDQHSTQSTVKLLCCCKPFDKRVLQAIAFAKGHPSVLGV